MPLPSLAALGGSPEPGHLRSARLWRNSRATSLSPGLAQLEDPPMRRMPLLDDQVNYPSPHLEIPPSTCTAARGSRLRREHPPRRTRPPGGRATRMPLAQVTAHALRPLRLRANLRQLRRSVRTHHCMHLVSGGLEMAAPCGIPAASADARSRGRDGNGTASRRRGACTREPLRAESPNPQSRFRDSAEDLETELERWECTVWRIRRQDEEFEEMDQGSDTGKNQGMVKK
ncbi:hypothetical protein DFH07DRAFT_779633 [Mycena maculata]|uniref:Uncharacterized protein n=1 Tax=Mycena maculata TaxID=230809 RepID=A0AAD7MWX2_9AGAR|nr:hypothetical protein DFH07DRAFT_779633 [Mycena maculata]